MKLARYIFILCITVVSGSCKKYGHGYVKGTVLETGTETPLAGATIILKYWKDGCSSCPYFYDSTYTDSQGKFIIYYKKERKHLYEVYVRDNNHYGAGSGIDEKKRDYIIHADPFAYLKLRLKKLSSSSNSCSSYDNGVWYYHHDGSPVDTLFPTVTRIRANKDVVLSWTIHYYPQTTIDTEYKEYSRTIRANKQDTITETIEYN